MNDFETLHHDDLIRIGSWDSFFDAKSKEPAREGSVPIFVVNQEAVNRRSDALLAESIAGSRKFESAR
jgi:hypothetical protein